MRRLMSCLAFQWVFLHGDYYTFDELSVTAVDIVHEWLQWVLGIVLPDCLVADIFAELSAHLFNNYELIIVDTQNTTVDGSDNHRNGL